MDVGGLLETKMTFENTLRVPATILAQFPYIKTIILKQTESKVMEITHFYLRLGAYRYMYFPGHLMVKTILFFSIQ